MADHPPPLPPARVRVEFDDRHLLSKPQRSDGLRRCWLLLRPQFSTVADVASHLAAAFNLTHSCPDGLLLSIDEYVLPSFESVSIFRDKDIVRVRKKVVKQKKIDYDTHDNQKSSILETRSLLVNNTCLAIEDSHGDLVDYRGKSVEDAREVEDISVSVRTALNDETHLKRKRELSHKPKESKRKKFKINNPEEPTITAVEKEKAEPAQNENLRHKIKRSEDIKSFENEKFDKPDDSPVDVKKKINFTREMRNGQDKEDCYAVFGEVKVCGSIEKVPSRSARRKKAKRQMWREIAKQQMGQQVEESQKVTDDIQGAIHNQHVVARRIHACLEECKNPKNDREGEVLNHPIVDKGIDLEEVVPVIVRPGHIRFESIDEEQDKPQSNGQMETLQWNGVTNKKKGQKWGREKTSSKNNEDNSCNIATTVEHNTEEGKHVDEKNINFESLFHLTRPPKEGDVLVYRVVELSSLWCPELSPFRVGRVSSYDNISLKIVLLPVPEYPIFINDNKDAEQGNMSIYLEDGSLEIEYASLVDVRLLKACESEATVTSGLEKGNTKESAPTNNLELALVKYSANGSIVPVAERSPNSGWEQITQALTEKKAELEKKDDWGTWNRNENAFVPWPYRGPKRHALGPTLAFLRGISGNGGKSSGKGKYIKPR